MRLFPANVKLYPFPDYQRFQELMLKIRKARELIHIDLLDYGMVSANTASSEPQSCKEFDWSQDACRGSPDVPNESPD